MKGRRKEARAVVRCLGQEVKINGKSIQQYFVQPLLIANALKPFTAVGNSYPVHLSVQGGGLCGQSDAIKLAISRWLVTQDETFKPMLGELLRYNPAVVNRKRTGFVKARKRPTFVRR